MRSQMPRLTFTLRYLWRQYHQRLCYTMSFSPVNLRWQHYENLSENMQQCDGRRVRLKLYKSMRTEMSWWFVRWHHNQVLREVLSWRLVWIHGDQHVREGVSSSILFGPNHRKMCLSLSSFSTLVWRTFRTHVHDDVSRNYLRSL